MLREEYPHLPTGEQIAMIGGVTEWLGESMVNKGGETDAWRRVYPEGFIDETIPGMIGIDVTNTDDDESTQANILGGMRSNHLASQSTHGASATFRAGGINPQ